MEESVHAPDPKMTQGTNPSSPKPASPAPTTPTTPTGAKSVKSNEEPKSSHQSQSPRHAPRLNQRRPVHKKKQNHDHDQSWRAAAWTGSPIVATGPLSSLWNNRPRSEGEKLSKTNVYIRDLPANMTDNELISMCSQYGRVNSAKALVDKTLNRGYGFVDFDQSLSADTAVRELRAQGFFARMAKVTPRQEQGRGDDPTNLYLANLPPDFSENHVECLLNQYGRITSARVLRDDSGRSRGVGFARMDSLAACERAITSLNGVCSLVPGRPLLVKFADNKKSDSKSRARPPASPQIVWWPNTVGYQQLAVQNPSEHVRMPISPMQAQLPPQIQHMGQPPAQMQLPQGTLHQGPIAQSPLGGHALYMNYGYRYVSVSSAPPLSSPTMMPIGGSMADCWSPGDVEAAALVDGLN